MSSRPTVSFGAFAAWVSTALLAAFGLWLVGRGYGLCSNCFFPIAWVLALIALHFAGISSLPRPIARLLLSSAGIVMAAFLAGVLALFVGGVSAAEVSEERWLNWTAFGFVFVGVLTPLLWAVWRATVSVFVTRTRT